MFNKLKVKLATGAALAAVTLGAAPAAHAVTFDFVAYAAGNEHGAVSETLTNGGLSVTVSGRSLDNTLTYLAYFDDLSGGEPGGLGVCKHVGVSGECDPDQDDNLGHNEVLQLLFNTPVVINSLELSNGTHIDLYNGNFGVAIDSSPTTTGGFTPYPAQAVVTTIAGAGTLFSFISNSTFTHNEDVPDLIYISKIDVSPSVPEPATMSLLGLAAAGLAGARRRKLV